ncbi:MAG: septation protein SepH [Nocardioidaceae bacterium]
MRDLALVGLSDDHDHVVLRDDSGEQFRVPVDESLQHALTDTRARPGQQERTMDSALRPRDIQTRIRAGESPEAVADVAQVPVEKIMGYAVPVLAERAHMCERARRAPVRRKHTGGPSRLLGDAIEEQLRSRNCDPEAATWDSWRRDDGRWTVVVTPADGTAATYLFDVPGRYVMAHDDAGRTLVGDEVPRADPTDMAIASALAEAELTAPARLRTRVDPVADPMPDPMADGAADGSAQDAGPDAGLDAGLDDGLDGGQDAEPETATDIDEAPTGRTRRSRLGRLRSVPAPAEQMSLDDLHDPARADAGRPASAPEPESELADTARAVGDDVDALARATAEPDQGSARRRRARGRTSVPSWDEIMFGGKPRND